MDFGSGELRQSDPVTIGFLPTLEGWTRGGGEVGIEPRSAAYAINAPVTLTATPTNGWVFLFWAGDASSTNPVLNVTMDRTKSIEAVFGTFLTNSAVGGAGEVTRDPADGPYPFGSTVRLSAAPHPGKYFNRWVGTAVSGLTDNPLDLTVTNANQTVSAFFSALPANTFALTVLVEGEGAVTRSLIRSYYTNGVSVSLTATPGSNQVFTGWSGDASGAQNPLSVVMNSSKTITARFVSTTAPVIALTSPTNHASFGAPANIELLANASDSSSG